MMMKTMKVRLVLLSAIGLLAVAFLLVPQTASASTIHSQLGQRPFRSNSVTTKPVYPRLSLAGCSRQDGFNGQVQWSTIPHAYIRAWGQVWDVCGTSAHLFLSWYSPSYHNPEIGDTAANTTTGVLTNYIPTGLNPGYIAVTVCASWSGKWTCGTPYKV